MTKGFTLLAVLVYCVLLSLLGLSLQSLVVFVHRVQGVTNSTARTVQWHLLSDIMRKDALPESSWQLIRGRVVRENVFMEHVHTFTIRYEGSCCVMYGDDERVML